MQVPQDASTDIELLKRVVARDASAISDLYDKHSRLLYCLIYRILHDRAEAEEVLQEVFLQVWSRGATYNEALGAPIAWLVRIARNRAIDRMRANQARMKTLEAAFPDADIVVNPETTASLGQQQRAVAEALGMLPREQRILIEQAYFLGFTQSELSERHNLPLGTVKTRIRSGMLLLREQLSPTHLKS